jgi:hypothetical protein
VPYGVRICSAQNSVLRRSILHLRTGDGVSSEGIVGVVLWCRVVWFRGIACRVVSCGAVWCRVVPCGVVCCVMLRHVASCSVM